MLQNRLARRVAPAVAAAALIGVAAGCSTATPAPNQRVVYYSAGDWSPTKFESCEEAGTRNQDDWGGKHFYYATDQRYYKARADVPNPDQAPFTTVSKDNAEMIQPAELTFTLNTGDCDVLRAFHEAHGLRFHAYTDDDDKQPGNGWRDFTRFAFSGIVDTTLDRIEQGYNWRDLWNNPATKAEVERAVEKELPDLLWQHLGSPRIDPKTHKLTSNPSAPRADYISNLNITLLKPTPRNDKLATAVADEQASVARANSAQKQADADVKAAHAQVAVAEADAAKARAEVNAYGPELWLKKYQIDQETAAKKAAIEKGLNPYPNPVLPGVAVAR